MSSCLLLRFPVLHFPQLSFPLHSHYSYTIYNSTSPYNLLLYSNIHQHLRVASSSFMFRSYHHIIFSPSFSYFFLFFPRRLHAYHTNSHKTEKRLFFLTIPSRRRQPSTLSLSWWWRRWWWWCHTRSGRESETNRKCFFLFSLSFCPPAFLFAHFTWVILYSNSEEQRNFFVSSIPSTTATTSSRVHTIWMCGYKPHILTTHTSPYKTTNSRCTSSN